MKILKIISLLFIFAIVATTKAQTTISIDSDVQGKSITGVWKKGLVVLKDGTVKEGETKGYSFSGDQVKTMKFRADKDADTEKFKANDCKLIKWGDTFIVPVLKNFKKPKKGYKFYVALYYGKNISVYFDPKANKAGFGGINFGENLSFLVHKDNKLTKIKKYKYRKQIRKLFGDNPTWVEKSKDKKWFKYRNIFEVAEFYDKNK
ncbi:hypothetical protein [Polaribacter cellanae]|uniref:DUF4468 domain-containing protein n=1 Tax=Polaribacter cellanae TaxID=2818493 RepID=A0A975CRP2_9FLAO|nr:hypothetical protein [Polaribacter cellanae]QTE24022.1 hypothetical protein J3359_07075 [Polaribacter cellanae]